MSDREQRVTVSFVSPQTGLVALSAHFPYSRALRIAKRGLDPVYGRFNGGSAELRDPATNELIETVFMEVAPAHEHDYSAPFLKGGEPHLQCRCGKDVRACLS